MTTAETSQSVVADVNGQDRALGCDPSRSLLSALRNDVGLCGVRSGCNRGECGACTVLVDGHPSRSCQVQVGDVAGRSVTTPEGLGTPAAPHDIQSAFLEEQAAQCGYCINGMIMTIAGMRDRVGDAGEVRRALDEHICRCFAHLRIERAALAALGVDAGAEDPGWVRVEVGRSTSDGDAPDPAPEPPDRRVASWVRLTPLGRIEVSTGKVELGQGLTTAIAQIAAAHIGVPFDLVDVAEVATDRAPDEGRTAGSDSIDTGGAAVAAAGVAFRRLLLDRASRSLDVPVGRLALDRSSVVDQGGSSSVTFRALASQGPLEGDIGPEDVPHWSGSPIGTAIRRPDLVAKVTGAPAFVHDLAPTGMVHARVLLPPWFGARRVACDVDAVRAREGIIDVLVGGSTVVVVAEREEQAERAIARLAATTRWEGDPPGPLTNLPAAFRELPMDRYVASVTGPSDRAGSDDGTAPGGEVVRASYEVPYQSHAPVAPSCAVAVSERDVVHVWSHTQGVHPLRRKLAQLLGVDPAGVEVHYVPGPGCYGQTLADDAAGFAAVAARAVVGRPVRFVFSVEDEFAWDPHAPAGTIDLEATLDANGCVRDWRHRAISDGHGTRAKGDGLSLMVAWLDRPGAERPWAGAKEAGARNAVPPYAFASVACVADAVRGPLRTGSLRTLGSFMNVFAAESFVDELAERAVADPVEFRLALLRDRRAARVLETAADRIGWLPRVGPSGRGLGVAFSRYKDVKAYVAQAVEVEVDTESAAIRVVRIVTVCDAGAIINPDGLANQLEGGTLQALSRALHERASLRSGRIDAPGWASYPVLRAAEVPAVETLLIEGAGPPLGAGEASTPPLAPALANAIDDAVGVRMRRLPLGGDALRRRLVELDEEESRRVLL